MSDWSEEFGYILRKVGRTAGSAARAVKSALDNDPNEILCYRGFGNASRAWIYGRVVEKREFGAATEGDSTLRNLLNTYRRADSDPLPFADVSVTWGGTTAAMRADDEGFFGGWIDSVANDPHSIARDYTVELVAPIAAGGNVLKSAGEVFVPSDTVRFGVISDIDDTVIQSRVSSFIQAARAMMLGNARTRLPFPGVAAFYRALQNGSSGDEKNPIFYVSSSPWNIYDVISEFMGLQHIPAGPILLRDWDIAIGALSSSRHFEHKSVAIKNILGMYPHLSFILIGDSSQHDPEIYSQVVSQFPGRIHAVYIRDVIRSPERTTSMKQLAEEILAAHATLVISDDTLGAARHAAGRGWIDSGALTGVGDEKRADEGTSGSKVAVPDGGKPGSPAPPEVIGES